MDDALQLDLGDIECNVGPDGDGIDWTVALVDDAPETRGGTLAPTGRHGVSLSSNLRGGRMLGPEGAVQAPSQTLAWDAAELLRALGFEAQFDMVWHETVTKFLTVTQRGAPKIDDPIGGWFEFQLDLIAAFPFRRAVTEQVVAVGAAATVALTNGGTVPAYPIITTTSAGAVDFTIGGRNFATASVPSGTVIDMWARTVTGPDASSLYTAKVPATEWLSIPAGTHDIDNSGIALSVAFHDTYA